MRKIVIGLSVSYCIADVLAGLVELDQVMFIVAGTQPQTEEQFDAMLHKYANTYWKTNPVYGMILARTLWNEGRIIQPQEGRRLPYLGSGHWAVVTNTDNIIWGE
jgi:hypothetical protein